MLAYAYAAAEGELITFVDTFVGMVSDCKS